MDNSYEAKNKKNGFFVGCIIIIIIVIILIIFGVSYKYCNTTSSENTNQEIAINNAPIINRQPQQSRQSRQPQQIDIRPQHKINKEKKINNNINKLYYTDEVNPIVMGGLYKNKRPIYTQRNNNGTPVGIPNITKSRESPPRGLSEYNSSHYYKDVGVSTNIWKNGQLTNQNYSDLKNSLESFEPNLYNDIANEKYNIAQQKSNINKLIQQDKASTNGIPQNWNLPSEYHLNYAPKGSNGMLTTMFVPDHDPLIG